VNLDDARYIDACSSCSSINCSQKSVLERCTPPFDVRTAVFDERPDISLADETLL